MSEQKTGKLYVVATPIGNLGDFSPRAIETLETVDFIAAEDTRVGAKLLNKFEIKKPQVSYFEHNRRTKGDYILGRILEGESCAIITDAGTPAISDPGTDLVDLCAQNGVEVVAVPGCSAVVAALSISGMACGRFTFEGFLPVPKKERRAHLEEVKGEKRTMVFYEAPHKLLRTLEDMLACWGDRRIALCREITKLHEECRRTTLSQAVEHYTENPPRGEFVLVIEGCTETEAPVEETDLLAEVQALVEGGMPLMGAVKQVAKAHNASKNKLYQQALEQLKE
ncbi:MAG: 16S rRNA (cytidine(1402)-2'-O)-methyltransferase [Clostridia bacterium]|nr:16S rRNA (cytidine(1402)-2'-O)-methyltransferase [Clostridia bacterium]